ncbi:MAG: hypothetical protein ACRC2T_05600 [Thermoguttaceae bacterium]
MLLDKDEYVEQAFFYRSFLEQLQSGFSTQEILQSIRNELLITTKLPLAIDFLLTDMKLTGGLAAAMSRLNHYFTSFQTFVIAESERDAGRFDFRIALQILEREAKYRSENATTQGLFFYQFETVCRNRLGYDKGLTAISGDPVYDQAWKEWLDMLSRQIGLVDFADMIYVRSAHYRKKKSEKDVPILFGEREGRIALATRKRDPVYLFAALARHLGYPSVPSQKRASEEENIVPLLQRRLELLENRLILLEEELRGGINIDKFIVKS